MSEKAQGWLGKKSIWGIGVLLVAVFAAYLLLPVQKVVAQEMATVGRRNISSSVT